MADNGSTPPPYGGPQTGFSGRGARFFDWMRNFGVVRSDGWVGGVCAGIAYRIGIDPLIVRGIAVVAAILGAPVLLLYALAWALLPDRDGRIHLQRLFDGDFQPPIVAIGVLLVLSLLPWTSGVWWLGGPFGHDPGWGDIVGRIFWTLIVLGAATTLIVFAVRNSARRRPGADQPSQGQPGAAYGTAYGSTSRPPTAHTGGAQSATSTVPDASSATATATAATAAFAAPTGSPAEPAADAPTLDTAAEPSAPPAPSVGASDQDYAAWRERQVQWQAEHAQWKQRLAEDMRAVKTQRSAELRTQASVATADAEARRAVYRATNPRVGAAFGWMTVGLALVAGALTSALWGPLTGLPGYALTAALAAATLVFGVAALIAGFARRRSGFLIFLGILLAVFTGLAAVLPTTPLATLNATIISDQRLSVIPDSGANYLQGAGQTTIDLSQAVTARGTPVVNLAKGSGETTVLIPEDATVRVETTLASNLTVREADGDERTLPCDSVPFGGCRTDITVGPAGPVDAIVRIAQADEVVIDRVEK